MGCVEEAGSGSHCGRAPWPSGQGQGNKSTVCLPGVSQREGRGKESPTVSRPLSLGNFCGMLPEILGESSVALAAGVCLPCEQGVQLQFGPTAG